MEQWKANLSTLCNLDALFCNTNWNLRFYTHVIHAIFSSLSDHCPLLLDDDSDPHQPRTFMFNFVYLHIPRFKEIMENAWDEPTTHSESFQIPLHNLQHMVNRLSTWSHGLFSKSKVLLHAALLIILQPDIAQENRVLSTNEYELQKHLQKKVIGLSAIERARKTEDAKRSDFQYQRN